MEESLKPHLTKKPFELGLYSFVENTANPLTGTKDNPEIRLKDLIEEIELADQLGLDVFGIGEHHRQEYLASSPAIILAAAATRTKKIKLASAVTVLSSDDPVRVFQDFATLDLLSFGRAEIVAGRGSFIESFPLFGYNLQDYNSLFEEKLELLLKIRESLVVRWTGKHRPDIIDLPVYPRPLQEKIPVWIAVGGTPESVVRAANLGLPLAIAIIGGQPAHFRPFIDLYWDTAKKAGHDLSQLKVSINSHGFLADTNEQAVNESFAAVAAVMSAIGRERGWPPMTRQQYENSRAPHGHLAVGDAEFVTEKILQQHSVLGHDRHVLQLSVGTLPHKQIMHAIELYGGVVAPAVRKAIAAE